MDIPYLKSFPSVDDNRQQLAELGLEHNALELNIYGFTVVEPEKTGFGGSIASLARAVANDVSLLESEDMIQAAIDPVALTLVRFLIGVNAHLSGIAPFINPQKELSVVPLHSDVNLPTPLPESPFMATACWILDDVDDLYVIPGSHRFGHNPGTAGAVAPDLPEIILSVKAGSLAVWHGHLWYGVKAGAARKLNILPYLYARQYMYPLQEWSTAEGDNQEWAAKFPELEQLIIAVNPFSQNVKSVKKP